MGIPVLIMGESGSGKSTSLRNFSPDEIGIFNVASKPLPFRSSGMKLVNKATYAGIMKSLKKNLLHCYAIDDSQYLMCFEMFARAKEKGYEKFTDMALNFYSLLQSVISDTDDSTIVYFLHHVENEDGILRAKTSGKMLREKLTVEGLFSIVLLCEADEDGHHFVTQSEGRSTAKSPLGMFGQTEIDNDLKMVDTTIRDYYGLNKNQEEK